MIACYQLNATPRTNFTEMHVITTPTPRTCSNILEGRKFRQVFQVSGEIDHFSMFDLPIYFEAYSLKQWEVRDGAEIRE